ncbi:MAG: biopolymer transporter ExbD [Planctomycetota bacterium]
MNIQDDEGADELVLNLTPMIDVIFLLLIFFMVATTFQDPERQMDVDLPEAQSGDPVEQHPEELIIHVLRDGSIHVGPDATADEDLLPLLVKRAEHNPDLPVTIRGDRQVAHERIIAVMDACGQAGLQQLSLGTLEAQ